MLESMKLDGNNPIIPMFLGGGGDSDPDDDATDSDDDGTGPDSDDYSEDSEP